MSEHDEPKTALARLIYSVSPDTQPWDGEPFDFDDRRNLSGHNRGVALRTADVLLAEGYTTSPAPEATETVEWGVLHPDGFVSGPAPARWIAEATVAAMPVRKVITRTRTSYADRVTEWVPVDRAADEHEEGGR